MTDLPANRTPEPTGISRRAIAKGAAWAVPAVLLAAPAPALAASLRKDPGINGWVLATTNGGGFLNPCRYTVTANSNLSGTGPDGAPYGLYLYDTKPTDTITNAKITYWIIGNQTANVVTRSCHSDCWKYTGRGTPQTKADGLLYTPYHFEYRDTPECRIDPTQTVIGPDGVERVWLGHFHVQFNFTQAWGNCGYPTYWVQRSIDIDINDGGGPRTLTFERRAGALGPFSRNRMSLNSVDEPTDDSEVVDRTEDI